MVKRTGAPLKVPSDRGALSDASRAGPFGKRLHADLSELLVGDAQLRIGLIIIGVSGDLITHTEPPMRPDVVRLYTSETGDGKPHD